MDLSTLPTQTVLPLMRQHLRPYAAVMGELDHPALLQTCRQRALQLWNTQIVPDLDITEQRRFERALAQVGMRAGLAIPMVFGFGFAFGAACHTLAGGDASRRDAAAATVGLYMFIQGVFDHLLDEHPQEFGGMGESINAATLKRWALDRDLDDLNPAPGGELAQGLLRLYRVYFLRCHRALEAADRPDEKLAQSWLSALRELHRVEMASVDRRISQVPPSQELAQKAEGPSSDGFWGLGVSACLGLSEAAARRIEPFARDFGRLTWYVDDAADIEKDIAADIWSGLAIRLAMSDAAAPPSVDQVVMAQAQDAGKLVEEMVAQLGEQRWEAGDKFTLAQMLWAHLWGWLGGVAASAPPMQRVAGG